MPRIKCKAFDLTLKRSEENTKTLLIVHSIPKEQIRVLHYRNDGQLISSMDFPELSPNETFLIGRNINAGNEAERAETIEQYNRRLAFILKAARHYGVLNDYKDPRPKWW